MSVDSEILDTVPRAVRARVQADARLRTAIDDLFLPDNVRLSTRTRLAAVRLLTDTIGGIEADLRRQTTRVTGTVLHGAGAAQRLVAAGLLRDKALVEALLAEVQHREIVEALPAAVGVSEEASLLVRLTALPDRVVSVAARSLLAADSAGGIVLPTAVQQRLVWAVAAAIRPVPDDIDADRAIADAASRSLRAHDDAGAAGAAAMRLAAAIDARHDEVPPLLLGSLGDRRLSLFIAVLAHAIGLDYARTQSMVLEPDGERLWLALRVAGLDRPTIARIALALSDADPRRDIESVADRLDAIASVDVDEARLALVPETLAPAFREAIRALAWSEQP